MAAPQARSRLAALALLLTPSACGAPPAKPQSVAPLLSGSGAPISPAELDRAAATARRFARAYARSIYRAQPPTLPGATAQVTTALRAAAARVPPTRRHLDPQLGSLRVEPETPARLAARITILDGRSPPFTVGFVLSRRAHRWIVTSISPPG